MKALIALAAVLLAGCGTIETKSKGGWGLSYSGAKCSVNYVKMDERESKPMIPFSAIDVGLSAVLDTLLLPVDLIVSSPKGNRKLADVCSGR
jgi:uncharacterized protein YceK